jgi:hypothetical protein
MRSVLASKNSFSRKNATDAWQRQTSAGMSMSMFQGGNPGNDEYMACPKTFTVHNIKVASECATKELRRQTSKRCTDDHWTIDDTFALDIPRPGIKMPFNRIVILRLNVDTLNKKLRGLCEMAVDLPTIGLMSVPKTHSFTISLPRQFILLILHVSEVFKLFPQPSDAFNTVGVQNVNRIQKYERPRISPKIGYYRVTHQILKHSLLVPNVRS